MHDVSEKTVGPTPGLGFKILGGVCIAASVVIGFLSSVSLSQTVANAHIFRGAAAYPEYYATLIDTIIAAATGVCVLLSFVLLGIGSIIKTLWKTRVK